METGYTDYHVIIWPMKVYYVVYVLHPTPCEMQTLGMRKLNVSMQISTNSNNLTRHGIKSLGFVMATMHPNLSFVFPDLCLMATCPFHRLRRRR